MLLIFSTPEMIRNLWQLKTAVFLHWCLIRVVPLNWKFLLKIDFSTVINSNTNAFAPTVIWEIKKTFYSIQSYQTFCMPRSLTISQHKDCLLIAIGASANSHSEIWLIWVGLGYQVAFFIKILQLKMTPLDPSEWCLNLEHQLWLSF